METFTFLSNRGDRVTVTAINEQRARVMAMVKLWGPVVYPSWLGSAWIGEGLMLSDRVKHEEKA